MANVDGMEDTSTSNQTTAAKGEGRVEVTDGDNIAGKIDLLSLLTNELLDHVFDLAYSIDTPSTGALSKRLLPFHITGIYRRIFLTNPDNIAKLVRKISKSPDVAKTVKMLRLDCQSDLFGVFETIRFTEIGQFFRQLVNLESLDLGGDRYEWLDKLKSAHNSALASSLHHITSAVSLSTPQPLLDFTSFPTLRSLHVTAYDSHYVAFNTSGCSSLPLLTHLTVSGHFADDQSIASLCILCPSLTHLSLYAFDAIYVDLLRALPATLSRLELGTIDGDGDIGAGTGAEDCSLELSKFTLLQHLFLDDDLFSSTLPSSLANLQHLETLTLVGDQIFYVGLLKLLSTPTRPPSLRVVELRIDCIRTGSRVEVDESGRSIGSYEPGENDWQVSRDWTWPEYVDMGKMHDLEETCGVRQVAEESGVQVRGNFFEALERVNIYYLELANIAIYRCFRYKTFGPFYELQDQALFDARLPPLDLDSLDPKNLKLVKTDLPDEGWFALSLENGD